MQRASRRVCGAGVLLLAVLGGVASGQELGPVTVRVPAAEGVPAGVYRFRGRVFAPAESVSLERAGRVPGFERLTSLLREAQAVTAAGSMEQLLQLYAEEDRVRMTPRLMDVRYRDYAQDVARATLSVEPQVFLVGSNFTALASVHRMRGRDQGEVMLAFFRGWPDRPQLAAVQGLEAAPWRGLVSVLGRSDWRSLVSAGSEAAVPETVPDPKPAASRPKPKPRPVPRAEPVESAPEPAPRRPPAPGPGRLGE